MAVTAALVKELRERTGLGMMECKKALVASEGDIELAIETLRKSGQAKAAKKAGRTAAEGACFIKIEGGVGALVEINSETDFVARDENFTNFGQKVVACVMANKQADVQALAALAIEEGGPTLEEARQALVQKIGENIQVRRAEILEAPVVGSYIHNQKIAVLVGTTAGEEDLAKDVAMHVAAVNPLVVNPSEVPEDVQSKEKDIFTAQARESGKPDDIIEKMIVGRMKKFLAEVSLTEQPFVKDPDTKVGALVKKAGAEVTKFVRFEVGEGIEKEEVDFAAEVMATAKGE